MTALLEDFEKNKIKDKLNKVLDDIIEMEGMNTNNIMQILPPLMTTISKYKNIKGKEKKVIVLEILTSRIEKINLDENIKRILMIIVNNILPNSIDIIIDIARGKYKFENIKKNTKKCCIATLNNKN